MKHIEHLLLTFFIFHIFITVTKPYKIKFATQTSKIPTPTT
jgi:hypothetical protein